MKRSLALICTLWAACVIGLRAQDLTAIVRDAQAAAARFWSVNKDISYVENDSGDGWLTGPTARTVYWGRSGTIERRGAVGSCPVTLCDGQRVWLLMKPTDTAMSEGPGVFGGGVIRDSLGWVDDLPGSAKLTKKVTIGGRDGYVISWSTNMPFTIVEVTVDAERLYLVKRTELIVNGDYRIISYSEFRDVGGITVPMVKTESVRTEDEDSARTYRLTDLKVDQKFPAALFDPVRIAQEKR